MYNKKPILIVFFLIGLVFISILVGVMFGNVIHDFENRHETDYNLLVKDSKVGEEKPKKQFDFSEGYRLEKVGTKEKLVQLDEVNTEKISENLEEIKIKETEPQKNVKETEIIRDEYELQLLADKHISVVEEKKKILEDSGYEAQITKIEKNNSTFYRLRLKPIFSLEDGTLIGEAFKKQFDFVDYYWLDKVKKKD